MYEIKDIYKQAIKFKDLKSVLKKKEEIEKILLSIENNDENFYAIGYYSDLLNKLNNLCTSENKEIDFISTTKKEEMKNNGQLAFNF